MDKIYKFYADLVYYIRDGFLKILANVNGVPVVLHEAEVSDIANLPTSGLRIDYFTKHEDLPFAVTEEQFWEVLTIGYDPRGGREVEVTDLNPVALISV